MENIVKLLDADGAYSCFIVGEKASYCIMRQVGMWNSEYEENKRPFCIDMKVRLLSTEEQTGFKITFWIGSRNMNWTKKA